MRIVLNVDDVKSRGGGGAGGQEGGNRQEEAGKYAQVHHGVSLE